MQIAAAHNPIPDLISDEVYAVLETHDLLNDKAIRDYQIRNRFRELREEQVGASDAIELLREEHAYLQYDTIRKIVYKLNR
jgi:hypothetical protein